MTTGIQRTQEKQFINYLKMIAVLLVLNSHLDSIYPIPALGFGGGVGNALFFCVSGYTWAGLHSKKNTFESWYLNKIKRIWVPTVFTNLVFAFFHYKTLQLKDLFSIFVFPNKSWFCGAILLYAVLYYFTALQPQKRLPWVACGAVIVYVLWYVLILDRSAIVVESMTKGGACRAAHYFLCMLMGLWLRLKHDREREKRKNPILFGMMAAVCYGIAMGYRTIIKNYDFQFVMQIFTVISIVFFFEAMYYAEPYLRNLPVNDVVKMTAAYSWEIYLTQTLIIPLAVEVVFPVNLIFVLAAVVIASMTLRTVCNIVFALNDKRLIFKK